MAEVKQEFSQYDQEKTSRINDILNVDGKFYNSHEQSEYSFQARANIEKHGKWAGIQGDSEIVAELLYSGCYEKWVTQMVNNFSPETVLMTELEKTNYCQDVFARAAEIDVVKERDKAFHDKMIKEGCTHYSESNKFIFCYDIRKDGKPKEIIFEAESLDRAKEYAQKEFGERFYGSNIFQLNDYWIAPDGERKNGPDTNWSMHAVKEYYIENGFIPKANMKVAESELDVSKLPDRLEFEIHNNSDCWVESKDKEMSLVRFHPSRRLNEDINDYYSLAQYNIDNGLTHLLVYDRKDGTILGERSVDSYSFRCIDEVKYGVIHELAGIARDYHLDVTRPQTPLNCVEEFCRQANWHRTDEEIVKDMLSHGYATKDVAQALEVETEWVRYGKEDYAERLVKKVQIESVIKPMFEKGSTDQEVVKTSLLKFGKDAFKDDMVIKIFLEHSPNVPSRTDETRVFLKSLVETVNKKIESDKKQSVEINR